MSQEKPANVKLGGASRAACVPSLYVIELAYQQFVELCQRHPSNRWLPTIHAATDLEGGGHATVMELLTTVEQVDAECRTTVPWWGGVDVKAEHFMLDRAGQLKLVDPFYVAGTDLFGAALSDYAAFCRVLPAHRRRYMLQIPHFSQPYAADDLAALRERPF